MQGLLVSILQFAIMYAFKEHQSNRRLKALHGTHWWLALRMGFSLVS